MNTLEDTLRAALRETGEQIAPHSVPPLRLAGARRRGMSRLTPPGRWSALLVPAAAAASVAAVVAASLAISGTFHGHARAAGGSGGQAVQAGGAPLGGQAALREVPRYFVALSDTFWARSATVRSTVTGHTLATVTPPRPYRIFTWVSGAADDRTFVLAAQRFWHIGHGQAGMPAERRDNTTPTVFFTLTIGPGGHPAKLTRLAINEKIPSAHLFGVGLSPDGTRLALSFLRSVQVVTLATGAIRTWTASHDVGNWKPYGQVFSWTADGKKLAFQQWSGNLGESTSIRLLDTTAPGNSVRSARTVLFFPNKGGNADFNLMNTLLTPDGSRVIVSTAVKSGHSWGEQITQFSARTGKPVSTEDRFLPVPGGQNVLWAGPHGTALVVSDPRGKATRYGRDSILGVLVGNRFTPISHGALTTGQFAW